MHCETSADRFESAKTLLSYAFANYALIPVGPNSALLPVRVELGRRLYVQPVIQERQTSCGEGCAVGDEGRPNGRKNTGALKAGDKLGTLVVKSGDNVLGEYPIVAGDSVGRLNWGDVFVRFLRMLFQGGL